MGQKINPVGLRLGINRTSDSRWYADSADFGRRSCSALHSRGAADDLAQPEQRLLKGSIGGLSSFKRRL